MDGALLDVRVKAVEGADAGCDDRAPSRGIGVCIRQMGEIGWQGRVAIHRDPMLICGGRRAEDDG